MLLLVGLVPAFQVWFMADRRDSLTEGRHPLLDQTRNPTAPNFKVPHVAGMEISYGLVTSPVFNFQPGVPAKGGVSHANQR